tara:strand:+ start:583 stop:759 length:177 start_codon:yes stop_codon:yes gene_type:complete
MKEYEVTKMVAFTFIVEAESEEEAEDMAWLYDEQRELLNGKPHSASDYYVQEITVEEA